MFVFWSQSPIFDKESSKILQIELIIICFKIFIWQAIVDAPRFYGGLFLCTQKRLGNIEVNLQYFRA